MGNANSTVGRARAGDMDAVAHVWHESASSMDGTLGGIPPCEMLRQRVDAELSSGRDLCVAWRGTRIVGMLAVKPGAPTIASSPAAA